MEEVDELLEDEVDDFFAPVEFPDAVCVLLEFVVVMVSRLPLLQEVSSATATMRVVVSKVFIG